ncbi:MAG: hypothetical protein PHN75_09115 [Syntrophales bacterium]|nr:hypothetical protein [Syntrophales bacterium]
MAENRTDTGRYEFSTDENQILWTLSKGLHNLGLLILFAGVLFAIYLIVSYLDPAALMAVSEARSLILNAVDYGLWIIIALMVIYLSIMVMHLARPIRQIVETSGADMVNLMEFLTDLIRMVRICFSSLIVVCILMGISLLLLIVVF